MRAHPRELQSARDAERWLLSLELFGMRFGLERIRRLLTALGSPQERFRAIHVVGSNGKSSTTRMTAAILDAHLVRSGAYLSPHLLSFTERIRIAGEDVGEAAFAAVCERVRRAAEKVDRTLDEGERVTQFEALTAAALTQLADAGIDTAVVEAGLGGRWDATNVLDAPVVVLTSVGLEHTRWLGPTVLDIAREKLAVVKATQPPATLVLGPDLHPDAEAEALVVAASRGARVVHAPADPGPSVELVARGAFQRRNFAVAMAAAEAHLGTLDRAAVAAAAASTVVPGRFHVVAEDPLTVLDGAHNPAGFAALAESLPAVVGDRPLVAVLSVLDDKDAAAMLAALLPLCAHVVFTANANPRALPPATLGSLAGQVGWPGRGRPRVEPDPHRALALGRELAGPGGVALATGSIYLIADLLRGPRGADAPGGSTL